MNDNTYHLRDQSIVLVHGNDRQSYVQDIARTPEGLAVDALVASGDCFEMLASNLDQLSRTLPDNTVQQIELEHLIRTLLYLQRHYKINRKYT